MRSCEAPVYQQRPQFLRLQLKLKASRDPKEKNLGDDTIALRPPHAGATMGARIHHQMSGSHCLCAEGTLSLMGEFEDSVALLEAYRRETDPHARADVAKQLYHRYASRLIALARQLLSEQLAGKVEAEDIVQSVYKSFFRRVEDGRFAVVDTGKLWSLLARVTRHKVLKQAQRFGAQKRKLSHEQALADLDPLAATPSPEDITTFVEEVEQFLAHAADPVHREMLILALQGFSATEIGQQTQRTATRVRQVLRQHRERLEDLAEGLRVVDREF